MTPADVRFPGDRQIFEEYLSEHPILTYYQHTGNGEAGHCLLLLEERQTGPQPVSFERDGLTRREAEVLQWVAQGKTNAEIGCIIGISTETVKKHLEHIFEKLGVETRMVAATLALGWRSGV